MSNAAALKVTTSGDREIVVTRQFNAPRTLVWDAMTRVFGTSLEHGRRIQGRLAERRRRERASSRWTLTAASRALSRRARVVGGPC